jgi:DNA phosphorothioation-associated putative methyltransferase
MLFYLTVDDGIRTIDMKKLCTLRSEVLGLARDKGIGKRVGKSLYLHRSALADSCFAQDALDAWWQERFRSTMTWNLLRVSQMAEDVSFLFYPDFFEEPHPQLSVAVRVSLNDCTVRVRDYRGSSNRPILHRKELFLCRDHPSYKTFALLTETESEAGLLQDGFRVGYKQQWKHRLSEFGVTIVDHKLLWNNS